MNRRVMNGIVLAIIMLGAIGLITTLVTNPLGFFKQIAIYAAIAGVLYLLYRLFIRKAPAQYIPMQKPQRGPKDVWTTKNPVDKSKKYCTC